MTQPQWNNPSSAPTGWENPSSAPAEQWSAADPYANYQPQQVVPYQQPQQQMPYGYGMNTQIDHPQSTVVFVLGLLSVIGFSIVGPVAWIMGNSARKEVRNNPERYRSGGLLTAGWVMGIIGTCLMGLLVLYIIFVVFLAFGMMTR